MAISQKFTAIAGSLLYKQQTPRYYLPPEVSLSRSVSYPVGICAVIEVGVAPTNTFLGHLLVLYGLAIAFAERQTGRQDGGLPEVGARAIEGSGGDIRPELRGSSTPYREHPERDLSGVWH
jgi:hypothetical protein